jgi:hypothetical protein
MVGGEIEGRGRGAEREGGERERCTRSDSYGSQARGGGGHLLSNHCERESFEVAEIAQTVKHNAHLGHRKKKKTGIITRVVVDIYGLRRETNLLYIFSVLRDHQHTLAR